MIVSADFWSLSQACIIFKATFSLLLEHLVSIQVTHRRDVGSGFFVADRADFHLRVVELVAVATLFTHVDVTLIQRAKKFLLKHLKKDPVFP